ncbi:hypothetical protein SAMN05192561_1264 [Halopenitus malekzadehii]|uniref:Uncharacterized protein n=1 Tax=Halopenitus malekzadehii TaxID=1267564 RepID=A0A1H6K5S6_9EURY|nr:hypothetical protein [Halopenitus malekzadehii]SEH66775.1 hypothetical protein SAMN05192561_1264 [Halopenitus malekzadehii]
MTPSVSPGEEWPGYYRGYRLRTNPDGDVWWQVYQGTDRLHLDPSPDDLVEQLLSLKRLGGRVRVTEDNDVITREETDDGYRTVYVGNLSVEGELVPRDAPEFSVDVNPTGLNPGDLWPSVYDGAKFSFSGGGEHIWWSNPATNRRHPVETPIPNSVLTALQTHKPKGGSFRITPWNDVITLVSAHPAPDTIQEQFSDLPRVVKNIIKLRKERGVEMLPVYVGKIHDTPIQIGEPKTLIDELSDEEREELEGWAASLGTNSPTREEDHSADSITQSESDDTEPIEEELPDDDPEDWYTG